MVNEMKLEEEYYNLRRQLNSVTEHLDIADQIMNGLLNEDPEGYPAGLVSELVEMRSKIENWSGTIKVYQQYHALRARMIDNLGLKIKTDDEDSEFYW